MTTSGILSTIFSLVLLSCNYNRTDTTTKTENLRVDTLSADTTLKSAPQPTILIADTIKRFVVDDYPVTNTMLADKTGNNSAHKKQSGQTYSFDKAWFTNNTLNQTIVFELYTDYHRMVTYHFYNKDIPTELIDRMELHVNGGELATKKQKLKDFNGFLNQATKIDSSYFVTNKGFRLGDTKQKATESFGNPDKQSMNAGVEKLEWEFIGDEFYDGKSDLKGKPLAKDSFGHQILMYFKEGKLVGLILYNDIP
jgi:hypothetical protein